MEPHLQEEISEIRDKLETEKDPMEYRFLQGKVASIRGLFEYITICKEEARSGQKSGE